MKRLLPLFLLCALGMNRPARAVETAPSLSIGDATIIESNNGVRELLFPVTLSKAVTFGITASFKTRDITTQGQSDYVPQLAGQIVIKPGQTKTNVLIRVVGDTVEEKDESFLVQLGAPKRCIISDSDAIASIKDNDYAGQISITDTSVNELNSGVRVARLEVKFSQAPLHDVSIGYETKDDSAKTPGDYTTTRGTLLFKPGRLILSVSVPIVSDTSFEPNERCLVRISTLGISIAKSVGFITILNDDAPPPPPPSGKIAFVGFGDSAQDIYVMNASGTNLTRLPADGQELAPKFSPDGSKITFMSSDGNTYQVCVINADGTGFRKLTTTSSYFSSFYPSFSPDGTRIVYTSEVTGEDGAIDNEIFVMNADGTNQERLTFLGQNSNSPVYSPDGKNLAFTYSYITDDRVFHSELRVIALGGTGGNVIQEGFYGQYSGYYSPNSQKIAFSWNNAGQAEEQIYTINAHGSSRVQLTSQPVDANSSQTSFAPCFSPDGRHIAFTSQRAGIIGIWRMNADGSSQTQIPTPTLNNARHPTWAIGSVPTPAAAFKSPATSSAPSS